MWTTLKLMSMHESFIITLHSMSKLLRRLMTTYSQFGAMIFSKMSVLGMIIEMSVWFVQTLQNSQFRICTTIISQISSSQLFHVNKPSLFKKITHGRIRHMQAKLNVLTIQRKDRTSSISKVPHSKPFHGWT